MCEFSVKCVGGGIFTQDGEKIMDVAPDCEDVETLGDSIMNFLMSFNKRSFVPTIETSVYSDGETLNVGYKLGDGTVVQNKKIMPDIVNVQNPNDTTVFVEFADGTKEVAHCNEGDVFSLETGVLICIAKKMFSEFGKGSNIYNKVIKYAMTKLDAKKKAKVEEKKKEKEDKELAHRTKQAKHNLENRQRRARINEMTEAFMNALNKVVVNETDMENK